MITPPYLKKGSTIAIAATARFSDEEQIQASKELLQEQGYNVIVAPNVCESYHRFAGDDASRLRFLQLLLDDESLGAIWFARGGYGTLRIIEQLDWRKFLQYPKWLIGYSDLTVLHLKLKQLGVASIHGCNFGQVGKLGIKHPNVTSVLSHLTDERQDAFFSTCGFNIEGHARAPLVGGNLSMICNAMGTSSQLNTDDCILFLEDCDEYLYHYDRMMQQLKRGGLLKNLHGLIVGESSEKPEPGDLDFGYSFKEIVLNACKSYYYPVCFNAPFGHAEKNQALKLHTDYELKVGFDEVVLKTL